MNMTTENKIRPFGNSHFVGYVKQIVPEYVAVHIPSSHLLSLYHHGGEKHHPGIVGTYVAIEGEEYGFIGRILELSLSEKERLILTEKSFETEDFHPVAKVEILISFNYFDVTQVNKGLDTFPHIGAKVYSCTAGFLQRYLLKFGLNDAEGSQKIFELGTLTADQGVEVKVAPQSLFGRHCAIVGTTGGGKSWTVAKFIEELIRNEGKAVLIDATGEYKTLDGDKIQPVVIGEDTHFHYSHLGISDLFYLLRPSDRVQRPKLMEAIRSLKMVRINKGANIKEKYKDGTEIKEAEIPVENGLLKKSGKNKKVHGNFYHKNIEQIESDNLNFDIKNLSRQIVEECIWDSERNGSPNNFGGQNDGDISFCTSLVSRVNNLTNTQNFQSIFGFDKESPGDKDLIKLLNEFLEDKNKRVLRISLDGVGFEYQAREILANAIGRHLHKKAREGEFKTKGSLIVFVDEAHQFMNKTIQDEYSPVQELNAFDLIAKETRKFGLFLCLATQMPRDIPLGTLSQIGTFIVHRLINKYDKEAIENACSVANRAVLAFLPVLGRGEAILLGVDFPMPISMRIKPPNVKPDSKTPPVIST